MGRRVKKPNKSDQPKQNRKQGRGVFGGAGAPTCFFLGGVPLLPRFGASSLLGGQAEAEALGHVAGPVLREEGKLGGAARAAGEPKHQGVAGGLGTALEPEVGWGWGGVGVSGGVWGEGVKGVEGGGGGVEREVSDP